MREQKRIAKELRRQQQEANIARKEINTNTKIEDSDDDKEMKEKESIPSHRSENRKRSLAQGNHKREKKE